MSTTGCAATPGSLEPDDTDDAILQLLGALDIAEVRFALEGSGDSGDCDLEQLTYRDGQVHNTLPNVPVALLRGGRVAMLGIVLNDRASERPEGNWYDNEGGYGIVAYLPFEKDPGDRIVCDMTYRGDGDWGDDNEDEAFDDIDLADDVEDATALLARLLGDGQ